MGKLNFLLLIVGLICWSGPIARTDNYDSIWIRQNWGFNFIDLPRAKKESIEGTSVKVAIVDTGVDETIPIFLGKVNKSSKSFVAGDPEVMDRHGHGTHVAGIISAIIGPDIDVLALKYYDENVSGSENLIASTKAIEYAIQQKSRIINFSGGGAYPSTEEFNFLKKAEKLGILVVVAAGNDHLDLDTKSVIDKYYPCVYELSNVICVTNVSITGDLVQSANFGKKSVDVAAPGLNIMSTLPHNKYGYMSGTSQSTAYVSGVAGLIISQYPQINPKQLIKIIKDTASPLPRIKDKTVTGGNVNAYSALMAAKKLFTKRKD